MADLKVKLQFLMADGKRYVNSTLVQRQDLMSLTLYYNPISQPVRAVLALLALGKIKFEGKVLDFFKGETRTPEYLALNPFGGVPFITHDKVHLAESNAILQYLVEAYPQELSAYGGATKEERAVINQYLSWYQGSYRPTLIKIIRLKMTAARAGTPVLASDLEEAHKKVEEILTFLDKQLAKGTTFLAGNHISIADLLIFEETTNVELGKLDLSKWAHLNTWYNKVLEVPEVAEIHKQFKEKIPALLEFVNKVEIKH